MNLLKVKRLAAKRKIERLRNKVIRKVVNDCITVNALVTISGCSYPQIDHTLRGNSCHADVVRRLAQAVGVEEE